jgi:nicotinate-nucleotide adenylyltransferase
MAEKLKIALFGSSFNPPHVGHVAVLEDLLAKNLFDGIWLLPVYNHAFGKELPPFEERVAMLKILIHDLGDTRVTISEIERELGKNPSYSIDTVTELKHRHPNIEFHMIAGSDVKTDLDKWHRIAELKKILKFYFIPRLGYDKTSPYPKVSSSEIREKAIRGESITELTTPAIAEYIAKLGLYSS